MIHLDFETYSPADLKTVGAEVYAENPETEVLCAAWATETSEPKLWFPGDDIPPEWQDEEVWCAWNAPFEMAVCRHVLPRLGVFLPVEPKNWRCAMAAALHKGLPAALDKAALVTRIDQTKDAEGKRLMQRLAKPRKPTKKNPATRHIPTPEELHRLGEYCAQDVRTERAMLALTGHLPSAWQQLWEETTRMNLTGVKTDLDMCAGAQRAMADFTAELEGQLRTLTGGAVESGTKLNDMKAWLDQRGYFVPDMTADTVQSIIDDTAAPDEVRELARLRQQLSKSSSSKYAAMERATCRDGRAKNLVQCHGATTGRDAGRLFQYQNLPRPTTGFEDASGDDMQALVSAISSGDAGLMQLMYGDVEVALTNGLRPTLIAEPGSRFIAADLAGIENRVIAAYGEEEWKLDIFREIDRGIGRDIYCRTADTIFGFEVRKKDHPTERQVGKICELAFGYQGGVGAWRNFDNSDRHTDEQVEGYKKAWRAAHSGIVDFWYALERACVRAVLTNEPQETHGVVYEMSPCRRWLACRLPSGRLLWYYEPKVDMKPDLRGEMKPFVYYRAWRMGQWRVVDIYGGLLAENVTQATACDILMRAAVRARKRGYNIVMRVHDELVAEMPHGQGSLEELVSIMVDPPAWAAHMCIPLAASGWEGERYRK